MNPVPPPVPPSFRLPEVPGRASGPLPALAGGGRRHTPRKLELLGAPHSFFPRPSTPISAPTARSDAGAPVAGAAGWGPTRAGVEDAEDEWGAHLYMLYVMRSALYM